FTSLSSLSKRTARRWPLTSANGLKAHPGAPHSDSPGTTLQAASDGRAITQSHNHTVTGIHRVLERSKRRAQSHSPPMCRCADPHTLRHAAPAPRSSAAETSPRWTTVHLLVRSADGAGDLPRT